MVFPPYLKLILVMGVIMFESLQIQATEYEVYYPEQEDDTGADIYISGQGVTSIDAGTLESRWHVLNGIQTFKPVIVDSLLLVGSSRGLYAIDVDDGSEIWSIPSPGAIFAPVVRHGIAYAGSYTGKLMAIEVNTGHLFWEVQFEGWVYPPAVTGDQVVAGGSEHELLALNRFTGDLEWRIAIDQELVYRPIATADNRVVITTFSGSTVLINSESGKKIWQFNDKVPGFSPEIIHNQLVSGMFDGRIRSLDLADGRLLWQVDTSGHPQIHAYPSLNLVVASNGEGEVFALDARTGNLRWTRLFITEVKGTFQNGNRINVVLANNFNNTWEIETIKPEITGGLYEQRIQ